MCEQGTTSRGTPSNATGADAFGICPGLYTRLTYFLAFFGLVCTVLCAFRLFGPVYDAD